jgi:serine/threonine-protein kinase SRK2
MAPEVITNHKTSRYNARLADVWSCGVMLYFMLFHEFPFLPHGSLDLRSAQKKMAEKIVKFDWMIPDGVNVSQSCKDLLSAMLRRADSRISMDKLQEHPWFLQDLATGVANMNADYLHKECPADVQNMQAIEQVLNQAKLANTVEHMEVYDALIDDEIDNAGMMEGDDH